MMKGGYTLKSKYKIKPPSKKVLKKYWDELEVAENHFSEWVGKIEAKMEKETGIKGIEFFRDTMCGDGYVGIGNMDRTMKLQQRY